MGASQEKRRRQQDKLTGVAKTTVDEAAVKAKKTRRTTVIVIVAVLVCFAVALFVNSKYIRRNGVAMTIGDTEISVTEFNYYYYNSYYEYYGSISAYYPDQAASMLPNPNEPLSSQIYNEATGQTWSDYFESTAVNTLTSYYSVYNAAKAAGYELSADGKAAIENEIASLDETAAAEGFSDADAYLSAYYGKSMNVDVFRKCAEVMSIATEYDAYYRESLEYTDEQISDKLASDDGGYDQFVYRYFYVAAEQIEETQYEGDEAGLEAAQAAALAEAKKIADEYRAGIKSEDDFIAAAKDYDPDMLSEPDSTKYSYRGSQLSEMFKDWIMQSSRTAGDTAVLEGTSGYYVVYFISRDANDYNTVDIRAISIVPETVNQADYEDDEEGYNKAVEAALDAAEDKAEKLYDEWKAEGGTEELFIQYANEHSADTAAEGGLFENIYKNALSEELNDWCFAAARKTGDSTVIRSDIDNGCFLLWYVGESDTYRDYLAETDMRNADYQQWYTELTENSEVDYKLLFRLTK